MMSDRKKVDPCTLADDLLTIAFGPDHVQATIKATNDAHDYLAKVGAKVATSKSILFASLGKHRQLVQVSRQNNQLCSSHSAKKKAFGRQLVKHVSLFGVNL